MLPEIGRESTHGRWGRSVVSSTNEPCWVRVYALLLTGTITQNGCFGPLVRSVDRKWGCFFLLKIPSIAFHYTAAGPTRFHSILLVFQQIAHQSSDYIWSIVRRLHSISMTACRISNLIPTCAVWLERIPFVHDSRYLCSNFHTSGRLHWFLYNIAACSAYWQLQF